MSARADEFEALYRGDADPWRMESSAYEAEKYAATLAALPRERYRSGLEIGCSIGVLTAKLAARCDAMIAVDVSATALDRARAREGCDAVAFRRMEIPSDWPTGTRDLVVLSEVLYFLAPAEVRATARHVARDLLPGGTVVAVNWLGACDRALDGEAAAELAVGELAARGFVRTHHERTSDYRIDVLERVGLPDPGRDPR